MVYVDNFNIFGSVHTIKKYLVFASKEIGPEIYANKTQYMVMCQDQAAGRSDNITTENSSFGIVLELKYLRKTCILDENLLTLTHSLPVI